MTSDNNMPVKTSDAGRQQFLPSTEYRSAIPGKVEEEIHLRDYLEVILRRKWVVLGMLFFTFISTLIFSLTSEKYYQAIGTIEVNQDAQKVTKFEDVVKEGYRLHEEFKTTQVALLTSDALARRVIDVLNLNEHPILVEESDNPADTGFFGVIKTGIKSFIQKSAAKEGLQEDHDLIQSRKKDIVLTFYKKCLEVTAEKGSMLIHVAFTSPSRQLSRDAVNTLLDEFINWKMDQKVESSRQAREYLMKQIDRAKINLEKAEEQQNQFARQAGIVSMDSRLNSVFRQLEDINAALGQAEADLIAKKSKYEQTLKDGPSNLPEVLESQLIRNLKSEYAMLYSHYEDMANIFHDEYPDLKTIRQRMQSIEARIDNESEKIFSAIRHDYQVAENHVEGIRARLDQVQQQALELNERATQYLIMAREVETNKAIYQSLLERAKEIETMAGISPGNIQIVDQAMLPLFPYKPDVKKNLLMAIVLGLMAGIGGAFLLEYFADTITNPDHIADRFHIPILGVIPLEKPTPGQALERIFTDDPRARMSEAFRTSRVSIQLSGAAANARCFAITSTGPGEGKTTIAANLAQTFANAGEKVVLIDADLRKPRLHMVFPDTAGRANGHGLSSYLAGLAPWDAIVKSASENLFLIPSGPIPPNPVELLASNRLARLIEELSETYDRIIFDAPPYYGFADILVLSRQVGGIILVSAIDQTTRSGLRHFLTAIGNVQATMLGCIVNKMNLNRRYGYKSYYHGYYQPEQHDTRRLS